MALASSSSRILCSRKPWSESSSPSWSHRPRTSPFTVSATPKKNSPRSGRFDSKNRRSSPVITKDQEQLEEFIQDTPDINAVDDGFVMPELPGDKPSFWEGSQWDGLGFFVQYMWAFGIVFALVACGVAVATYNEGATDFKDTPVYKESVQSRDLLDEPDAANSDVFESNPTEQAPSLE
ncbi:uncharacterized protein LOC131020279 [Salvia miltiorrhiza]|uniref:uncharacterized protein LOC131020279 n=1 Tax=Salvia miltiorrhiza TaxID=226208 RepID=UPI0025AD3694|nr:uncharacterized protein LOC131020279 [Salvia miltiorrhiza]